MKKEEEIAGSKTASELFSFAAPGDFKEQPQLLETLFKSDAMDVVDESEEGMRAAKAPIVEVVQPVPEYFYMNESLEAKGRWLEALMERAKSDDIPYTPEEEENLGDEEVYTRTSKFNIPVQDDIMAFGRICYEEPEEDGLAPKMTPVNTLLQGPLSIGSPRVKLILSK